MVVFAHGPQILASAMLSGERLRSLVSSLAGGRGLKAALALLLAAWPGQVAAQAAAEERRVALVIGSGDYDHVLDLDNPANDAHDMAEVLRSLGFEVLEHIDVDYGGLIGATRAFGELAEAADVALFYYAGHAIQYEGQNFLVPIDARLDTAIDIDFELIEVDRILKQLRTRTNIIFLDACRNNPFEDLTAVSRAIGGGGLAPLHASHGTFIAYATEPNRVAFDGINENHSPFTKALLKHIATPGLEIEAMMKRVRSDVFRDTQQQQVPWDESSLFDPFFFVMPEAVELAQPGTDQPSGAGPTAPPGELVPPLPNRPPLSPELRPLEVPRQQDFAALGIPPIKDPDGDMLGVQIVELPTLGTVRAAGKQIKVGDRLPVEQLLRGVYHPGPEAPVGPAGSLRFQVYDRDALVDAELPIVIVKGNEPPAFAIPDEFIATLGRGEQPLGIPQPSDPDGDSVFVRIVTTPRLGQLAMAGIPLPAGTTLTEEQAAKLGYLPPDQFGEEPGVIELQAEDGNHTVARAIRILLNRPPAMAERIAAIEELRPRANSPPFRLDLPAPSDPDGDDLRIVVTGLPGTGAVLRGEQGAAIEVGATLTPAELAGLMFRPEADGLGALAFEISDGRGGVVRQQLALPIEPANRDPRLFEADRRIVAIAGRTVALGLGRPSDPDGDRLLVWVDAVPTSGELLGADRPIEAGATLSIEELTRLQFRLTGAPATEPDRFRYVVYDSYGGSVAGQVEIAINQLPVAQEHVLKVSHGQPPVPLVPVAPTDPDGDALRVRIMSLPFAGRALVDDRPLLNGDRISVEELARATLALTQPSFFGPAGAFEYRIEDGRGGFAIGKTSIIVNAPPVVPANPGIEVDAASAESQPLPIQPPFDRDQDPLTIEVVTLPGHGAIVIDERVVAVGDLLTVEELGQLRYRAEGAAPAAGAGRFAYAVRDGQGGIADGGIDIAIRALNHPPEAASFDLVVQADRGPIALLEAPDQRPADPDGDPLAFIVRDLPWSGEIEAGGKILRFGDRRPAEDLASLLYHPGDSAGAAGAFQYRVEDGRGGWTEARIGLALNRPPRIGGATLFQGEASLQAGAPRIPLFKQHPWDDRGILPQPIDDRGDVLELEIVALPESEGLALWLDDRPVGVGDVLSDLGEFSRLELAADEDLAGAEAEMRFALRDDKGGAMTAAVALAVVEGPNNPPDFLNQGPRMVVERAGPQDLLLQAPRDREPLTVIVSELPSLGTLTLGDLVLEPGARLAAADVPQLRYDPGAAGPGAAGTLRLTAIDSKGASGDGLFAITVGERPNHPPIVPEQPVAEIIIGVGRRPLATKLPTDPDNDPLTIEIAALPENGELWFGDHVATIGMALTVDEFGAAQFTPHLERPLVRGGPSVFKFTVDDHRGGTASGQIPITTSLHDCDKYASSAENIDAVAKDNVPIDQLDPARGIPACAKAVADYVGIGRFRFQLARAQHAGGQYDEAADNYLMAAHGGDVAAQYNLAMLLLDPRQPIRHRGGIDFALDLLRSASESGWTRAQASFATAVFLRGEELPPGSIDAYRDEAMHWLKEAAQQDDPQALTLLGTIYAEGVPGIAPNPAQAAQWLEQAAKLGDAAAQTNLGHLHASGRLGAPDFASAARFYQAAAAQNDAHALASLGTLAALGRGMAKDPVLAVKSYAAAACLTGAELEPIVSRALQHMPPEDATWAAQTLLHEHGYDPGPIDGQSGRRTMAALQQFASDRGLSGAAAALPGLLIALADCQPPG
jgi:TPR repeat protein